MRDIGVLELVEFGDDEDAVDCASPACLPGLLSLKQKLTCAKSQICHLCDTDLLSVGLM